MTAIVRLLAAFLLVTGCTTETSSVPTDAGADTSSSSASCGSSIEGTACAHPGSLVSSCSCMDGQGIILICCNKYGIVRVNGCQDTWLRPSCDRPFGGEPGVDSAIGENGTTGKDCTDDSSCDPLGLGTSFCSPTGFSSGSLYPSPTCFSVDCDPGDGTKIGGCDKDTGVCVGSSGGGLCLPVCTFDDSGAAPKGCNGRNKCNAYGWSNDSTTMAVTGVGYCFGGCKSDSDCPTGNQCQVEDGLCVKTKVAYTKSPGDACVKADSGSSTTAAKCNCLFTTAEGSGYCANACYFGETTCGAGFSCDADLPNKKLRDSDVVFTKTPTGMAGYCLKNCSSDADCAGLNAYCDDSAGVTQKTCHVGKRPCVTDAHCPTGQTCIGATATVLGKCG